MKSLNLNEATEFVELNIGVFHEKRLENLKTLPLAKILKRKNPYLFKAKNIQTGQELVKALLDAHLSSQEEAIFGDFLENLSIFINSKVFNGQKSSTEGIDLEFNKEGIRYIVSIKSGPNWGNSSQIKKMKDNFIKAKKVLRTGNSKLQIKAVNGCCYGRDNNPDKGDYFKICGQIFWELISGSEELYLKIIEPLGHEAKNRNEDFQKEYHKIINNFTAIFLYHFCKENGEIDWDELIEYNSSKNKKPKILTKPPKK